jgi:Zn-dependent protease
MVLRNLDLLRSNPALFLTVLALTLIAILIAMTVHELSHGLVANRFGDPTAKTAGRLTLNPLAHIDPLGGLMFLLIGFGWAKPVPVDARYFQGNWLKKMALVAAAGPLSNVAAAAVAALPFRLGLVDWPLRFGSLASSGTERLISVLLAFILIYNLVLAAFNLIPLAPLDGSKILPGLVPRSVAESLHRLEAWGPGILMAVLMLGFFFNIPVISYVIGPVVNGLSGILLGARVL